MPILKIVGQLKSLSQQQKQIIAYKNNTMKDSSYDYLSKSSVTSPLNFKKSPNKYITTDSKIGDQGYSQTSTNVGRKQWGANQYRDIKKVSDDISNLRQTFDARTNANLRQKLAKYDFDNQDSYKPSSRADNLRHTTYNIQVSSPQNKDLTTSAVNDRSYHKDDYLRYRQKKQFDMRSPLSEKRSKKQDIDQKFKKYVETVDKVQSFKQQLENTSKMNEQLKRLKQDRKRRLEAKERQLNQLQKKLNKDESETFRKKNYYQYYTPKQPKSSYHDRFQHDKLTTTLDLSKYKSYQKEQPSSAQPKTKKYQSNYKNQPISASLPRKLSQGIKNGTRMEIGDFILGKNLGQGKFGVVYQAVHKKSGWLVALKKVPKDMIKSHLMIDQFILELKLQTFLNHENILSLYHHFDDKTHIYLVLEYMEQGTLFTHLKKNKTLGQKQVAKKMKQIASAIKYLHQNTIAHRDIKPQNIVMSHGVCKLCDFGWATICDDRRKTYCGTFDYAPPQILEGVQYDYTVDLWCLGVLAYQLLVGKAPFYHISRKQTMKKILNVENTQIEYPDHLSKSAVSFINDLIKKDPKQRLSSEMILQHPFLRYAEDKL